MSKELIEDIIEIVLENASCNHLGTGEYPRGPRFDDVAYSLDNEQEVIKKCVALIKKEVTEEWIKEKAKELLIKANILISTPEAHRQQLKILQNFIRSLVEEVRK